MQPLPEEPSRPRTFLASPASRKDSSSWLASRQQHQRAATSPREDTQTRPGRAGTRFASPARISPPASSALLSADSEAVAGSRPGATSQRTADPRLPRTAVDWTRRPRCLPHELCRSRRPILWQRHRADGPVPVIKGTVRPLQARKMRIALGFHASKRVNGDSICILFGRSEHRQATRSTQAPLAPSRPSTTS